MGTLANSEDPDKMQHGAAFHQGLSRITRNNLQTQNFEPRHEISDNVKCTANKALDHPAHTHSLARAFASRMNIL